MASKPMSAEMLALRAERIELDEQLIQIEEDIDYLEDRIISQGKKRKQLRGKISVLDKAISTLAVTEEHGE